MIFGDLVGLKLPDICVTYRWGKMPEKNLTQETCPDRGYNPGPLRDWRACYCLHHSGFWLNFSLKLNKNIQQLKLKYKNKYTQSQNEINIRVYYQFLRYKQLMNKMNTWIVLFYWITYLNKNNGPTANERPSAQIASCGQHKQNNRQKNSEKV